MATRIFPSGDSLDPEAYHRLGLRQQKVIHSPTLLEDRGFSRVLRDRPLTAQVPLAPPNGWFAHQSGPKNFVLGFLTVA